MGKPYNAYLQIKPLKNKQASDKIIAPDTVKFDYKRGKVLEVHEGCLVEVGDTVYFTGSISELHAEDGLKSFIRFGQILYGEKND